VIGGTIEARHQRGFARAFPIRSSCVSPQASSIGLVGSPVVPRFVESAAANKEPQSIVIMLGQQRAVLAVNVTGNIYGTALDGAS